MTTPRATPSLFRSLLRLGVVLLAVGLLGSLLLSRAGPAQATEFDPIPDAVISQRCVDGGAKVLHAALRNLGSNAAAFHIITTLDGDPSLTEDRSVGIVDSVELLIPLGRSGTLDITSSDDPDLHVTDSATTADCVPAPVIRSLVVSAEVIGDVDPIRFQYDTPCLGFGTFVDVPDEPISQLNVAGGLDCTITQIDPGAGWTTAVSIDGGPVVAGAVAHVITDVDHVVHFVNTFTDPTPPTTTPPTTTPPTTTPPTTTPPTTTPPTTTPPTTTPATTTPPTTEPPAADPNADPATPDPTVPAPVPTTAPIAATATPAPTVAPVPAPEATVDPAPEAAADPAAVATTGALPVTGSDAGRHLIAGLGLVAVGASCLTVARRRSSPR